MEVTDAKPQLQDKDPSQCVRVAVNIRPLITSELINGCADCITVVPGESQVQIGSHAFTFDCVYGNGGLACSKIFDNCIQPLVDSVFHGYNATVLAYGQTGSGKTYTMGTNYSGNDSENGIIPKVMESIFSKIDATRDTEFLIRVSFIEIFKEEVFDLLDSNSTQLKNECAVQAKASVLTRVPIQIRETVNGGITLVGVTEAEVRTRAEMVSYLLRGSLCRATASTNMNSQSSRSHAIFTISLEQKNIAQCTHGGTNNNLNDDILSAKLHLVDLAGSERAKRTGADGKRLREGIHINKGLLSLGNVISALGDDKKRKEGGHVPYRDSKLTRLLQDSLGGNSKTIMIACVSPADSNAEETLNTLKYANRARNIQNKAIINRDPIVAQTQKMRNQIEQLQAELVYLRGDAGLPFEELQILRKKVSLLEAGNAEMQRDLNEHIPFYESLVQCTLSARAEKVKIISKLDSAQDGKSLDEDHSTLNQFLDNVRSYVAKNQNMERKLLKFRNMSSTKPSRLNALFDLEDNEIIETNGHFTCAENYSHAYETKSLNFVESGDNGGEEKEREHAFIQEKLDNDLRELDKILQRKEAEMNQFTTVNTSDLKQHYEKKVLELEHEKKFLQKEIEELRNNLASISSVSDDGAQKLKAEYLQKLTFLESQVSDLKKRQDSQSHLLRQKQKSDDAAKRLQDEIQRIKSQKVQLQHKIKQESEQFRLWKSSREKEVMQLKKEGRRNEYEMHKLLALNQRQKMVLQRKSEEAAMATRRLKELLESRKASSRETSGTGNNEAIIQAIEHELEVITRVHEVQSEYDHQTDMRAKMAKELAELREEKFFKRSQNLNSSLDALSPGARNSRIFALESMLSSSSGVLVSMASQLSEAKSDERVFTGKGRWNHVRSLSDAKYLLNKLFNITSSTRCLLWDEQVLVREKDSQIKDLKEKVVEVNNRIRLEMQKRVEIPENLNDFYPGDGHKYQLHKDRCSILGNGKAENVQEDMDMSESEHSDDEDWIATDTEPETEAAPPKNRNPKYGVRSTIIPSEVQGGEMLRLIAAAAAADPSLHCTCGKASLCKTSKCKCRSNGVTCGASCGCLSKKCSNRVDPIASIGADEAGGRELDQNLASEGAMLLQSAFNDKTEDGCETRRRMPLSDIGNTMGKLNSGRPNRKKKMWKRSSIRLVQVPAGPRREKGGEGDCVEKHEASSSNLEEEAEDFSRLKLPRAMRSVAIDNNRPFRERNTTEAAAPSSRSASAACTDAEENRGSSNA